MLRCRTPELQDRLFAGGKFEAKLLVAQDVLVRSADIRIGRLMGKTISLQHPKADDESNGGPSNPATGGGFQVEAVYADNAFAVAAGRQDPSPLPELFVEHPAALPRQLCVFGLLTKLMDIRFLEVSSPQLRSAISMLGAREVEIYCVTLGRLQD